MHMCVTQIKIRRKERIIKKEGKTSGKLDGDRK